MTKNWVEELVAERYRLDDYIVITNLDLPMPKTERRRVSGHSDIDVLAIKNNEIIHVECQTWWGPEKKNEKRELNRLKERFDVSSKVLFERYGFLKNVFQTPPPTITKVFVTSGRPKKIQEDESEGSWRRLKDFCEENGIQLKEINDIVKEFIEKIREKYPKPNIIGKEESYVTRLLIHLIHNGFINERRITQEE